MATNNKSNHPSTNRSSSTGPRPSSGSAVTSKTISTTMAGNISATATTTISSSSFSATATPLHVRYPVNAVVELTLAPSSELVHGTVYATDEMSQAVVLQKSLVHTTLATEIRIVHVASIVSSNIISAPPSSSTWNDPPTNNNPSSNSITNNSRSNADDLSTSSSLAVATPLAMPLPIINRKTLEEREKRALRLAEENLRHINQKASPEGQVIFDRLLKACNEVVWKGESILVLGQIQVDPPYGPDQCQLVLPTTTTSTAAIMDQHQASLERVRKIVASVGIPSTQNSNSNTNNKGYKAGAITPSTLAVTTTNNSSTP